MASLAVEILDWIMKAVMAIADEGMDGWVSYLAIVTVGVGTSLATGINVLLAAPRALSLRIGHNRPIWRLRCCGRVSTGPTLVRRAGPQ